MYVITYCYLPHVYVLISSNKKNIIYKKYMKKLSLKIIFFALL